MIDKKRGYTYRRPFYAVDPNVDWNAGMIAFLAQNAAGTIVATTAASGTVPIGTFWKDKNTSYWKSTLEQGTFDSDDEIQLQHAYLHGTSYLKVTDLSDVPYLAGLDYDVSLTNGIITRLGGGSISANETVIIWYEYMIPANQISYNGGTNYNQVPDDTLGSGKISVVEGWSHIFTDQFDVTQTYLVNSPLRSNTDSKWTSASTAYPICGKVIHPPTAADPFLGIQQIAVAS